MLLRLAVGTTDQVVDGETSPSAWSHRFKRRLSLNRNWFAWSQLKVNPLPCGGRVLIARSLVRRGRSRGPGERVGRGGLSLDTGEQAHRQGSFVLSGRMSTPDDSDVQSRQSL